LFNQIIEQLEQHERVGLTIEDGVDIFIACSSYLFAIVYPENSLKDFVNSLLVKKYKSPNNNYKDSFSLCLELDRFINTQSNDYTIRILKEALLNCIPF